MRATPRRDQFDGTSDAIKLRRLHAGSMTAIYRHKLATPILFVNLDDLIAMQEGKDVLAAAFR